MEKEVTTLTPEQIAEYERLKAEEKASNELRDKQDFTQMFEKMFKDLEQNLMKNASDGLKAALFKNPAKSENGQEIKEKFQRMCQAVVNGTGTAEDMKYVNEMREMARAHNEGTNADGALAVPPEVNTDIFSAMQNYAEEVNDADIIPVKTNAYKYTPLLTTITFAETAELAAYTHSQITIEQKTINVVKWTGLTSFSDEVLSDANPNFYKTIVSCFAQAAQKNRASVMFYGSTSYDGIFDSAVAASGKTEVETSGQSAGTLSYANLLAAPAALPQSMLAGAKWYMHRTTYWNVIRGLTDGDGKPLIYEANAALNPTLLGFPVVFSEVITGAASVAQDTGFIAFGNLKNSAHFADRQQMDFMLSQHATVNTVNMFTNGGVGVRLSDRFGFLCSVPRFQADASQTGLVVIKTKA